MSPRHNTVTGSSLLMSLQRPKCSLKQTQQSWFSNHPARKAAPPGPATALPHLSAHIYLSTLVPWVVSCFWFWFFLVENMGIWTRQDAVMFHQFPLIWEWRIRAWRCTGTAMHLSVYPSRAVPRICTISETFLFPVCGVRIHSASSLHLQLKVNNF